MEFNEKLQELRKQKGLTQEELAKALFVSRTAVSKWESGKGYPNIESLKLISKFFSVTIDELLSGDELLTLAEEDTRQKASAQRDMVFGLVDLSAALIFFLPLLGQKAHGVVQAVSLLALSGVSPWLKVLYFAAVVAMIICGVLTLALQNCRWKFWTKSKSVISLVLNMLAAFLFIISMQPYCATLLFIFLIIKVLLLIIKV